MVFKKRIFGNGFADQNAIIEMSSGGTGAVSASQVVGAAWVNRPLPMPLSLFLPTFGFWA